MACKLSNGLCSLRPKVDRLCFVAEMKLARSGRVLSSEFYRAVMNSHARFTYDQVADALSGSGDESCQALLPNLECLSQVASSLLKRRSARGSIDLDIPEAFIVFDEDGQPKDSCRRPRNNAHRLIEDLMVSQVSSTLWPRHRLMPVPREDEKSSSIRLRISSNSELAQNSKCCPR